MYIKPTLPLSTGYNIKLIFKQRASLHSEFSSSRVPLQSPKKHCLSNYLHIAEKRTDVFMSFLKQGYQFLDEDSSSNRINNVNSDNFSIQTHPVGWGGRIRCKSLLPTIVPVMTLNHMIVRFSYRSFGECGVPIYCRYFQVHSDQVAPVKIQSMRQIVLSNRLTVSKI